MDTCLWVVGRKKPNPRMNSYMESRVWNLTLSTEFYCLYEFPCYWMVSSLSPNLGFC